MGHKTTHLNNGVKGWIKIYRFKLQTESNSGRIELMHFYIKWFLYSLIVWQC